MFTTLQESPYADVSEFENIESVQDEVSRLAPHRDQQRYSNESDTDYLARLLDIPVKYVTGSAA